MILTPHQRELARHALGLPNKKNLSYRNYFCGSNDDPHWNGLVDAGLATKRSHAALLHIDDVFFYLTAAGALAVLNPGEKLCPEDFPSLITRPMLFSAPMIRALHDGRKTQTRRILAPQPTKQELQFQGYVGIKDTKAVFSGGFPTKTEAVRIPHSKGNRLWVRETWRCNGWATDVATIFYKAHEGDGYTAMTEQYPVAGRTYIKPDGVWKPSIHMPRWISRMTLTVTKVRVQRLQDISEEDAIAEGCGQYSSSTPLYEAFDPDRKGSYREGFRELWNNLNADRGHGWNKNPWVTALTFTVDQRNIDEVEPND